MFVPEGKMFHPSMLRLRICSMEGKSVTLTVKPECTVDQLRIQAVSQIYSGTESVKKSLYYRVLHVNSERTLDELSTLVQNNLRDNDELLLIKKRFSAPPVEHAAKTKDDAKKIPTMESIKAATQHLHSKNMEKRSVSPLAVQDFKAELRKILISLIDAAQKILCLNPEAAKIFEEAGKYMDDHAEPNSKEEEVDPSCLEQLTGMGFSTSKAKRALLLNRMSLSQAVQWLLEHEGDNDDENPEGSEDPEGRQDKHSKQPVVPLPGAPGDTACTDSACEEGASASSVENCDDNVPCSAVELSKLSGPEKVLKMLETFRAYRRKKFKPSSRALKSLVEMGFSEGDAIDALRVHDNRQEEACEWLLSGGTVSSSVQDFGEGLDTSSPVYRAIMSNPVVQLGISNPRSLIAFLMILENPDCTQQWLNDPDTSAMLIQISRIYHAEKNAPQ